MSDERARQAVKDNGDAFLLEMGEAGGGTTRRDATITWTVGGSPIDYHNAIVSLAAEDRRVDAAFGEWCAALQARRLPGVVHAAPGMGPPDLPRILLRHHLHLDGEEPAMVAYPPFTAHELPIGLRMSWVTEARGLARFRDVLADGFGEGPREAESVHMVFRRLGLGGRRWRHVVAYRGPEPVACGSLFMPDSVAGIYFVATRPAWRRQGLGSAVTAWLMEAAGAAGAKCVVLPSSAAGFSLYRRLGFREVFRYQLWAWAPAAPGGGQ